MDAVADPAVAALGLTDDRGLPHRRRARRLPGPGAGRGPAADRRRARGQDLGVRARRPPPSSSTSWPTRSLAEEHLGGGRAQALFADTYRSLVSSGSARAAYRTLLTELAADDAGPLLFHCTAGKDRTGWGATVILSLLGADEDDGRAGVPVGQPGGAPGLRARSSRASSRRAATPRSRSPSSGWCPSTWRRPWTRSPRGTARWRSTSREGLGVPDEAVARLRERLIA